MIRQPWAHLITQGTKNIFVAHQDNGPLREKLRTGSSWHGRCTCSQQPAATPGCTPVPVVTTKLCLAVAFAIAASEKSAKANLERPNGWVARKLI
jgi:hypothetical protein